MRPRSLVDGLVLLSVVLLWVYSVGLRLPYMDQVPVYDADATTSEAHMWARIWSDEGAFKTWFATPLSPRSIETPTIASRGLYESWPPGAFVPVYLAAKLLGIQPTIPLVNWINAVLHGLIALTVAFAGLALGRLNRLGEIASGLIAVAACIPILLSRGPLFVFSQIYDVTTAVLIFTAIFLWLEVLYYSARSLRDRRAICVFQLIVIFLAFSVDWLPYTLVAFWSLSRVVAGYLGVEERLPLRRLLMLWSVPVVGFSIYLFWRLFAPGSIGRTSGIGHSIDFLVYKIMERMNLTHESQISGFGEVFFGEMHEAYLSRFSLLLIIVSTLIASVLLVVSFRRATDQRERRAIFANLSIMMLAIVPFYFHMLVLYQHTFIHRWAIMKAMFAYALIPFVILPISIFGFFRQASVPTEAGSRRLARAAPALAICALVLSVAAVRNHGREIFRFGPIDRDNYLMWGDIGRNTLYQDVVVSPVLRADPITKEIGASYKRVHHADSFADVDKIVERVCGDFNVVLALPKGSEPGAFGTREPAQVVDTGRVRLLRFSSYQGKAIDCPR